MLHCVSKCVCTCVFVGESLCAEATEESCALSSRSSRLLNSFRLSIEDRKQAGLVTGAADRLVSLFKSQVSGFLASHLVKQYIAYILDLFHYNLS